MDNGYTFDLTSEYDLQHQRAVTLPAAERRAALEAELQQWRAEQRVHHPTPLRSLRSRLVVTGARLSLRALIRP